MKDYDVIIIGAGNGGLAAAATIAREGKRVLVLEQHNLPGGCATSIRRGPFEFETTLHEMCQMGESGDTRRVVDGLRLAVEWVSIDEAYRTVITDPKAPMDITLPVGVSAYIDEIERKVPQSRQSLEAMFEMARKIRDAISWLADHDNDPKGLSKLVFAAEYSDVMCMITVSVDEMLRRLKMPKMARYIVEQYWDYISVDSTKMSFAVYVFMLYIYLTQKPWIAKDRSHEISLAFDDVIRRYGGDIWYNTPCVRIDVADNRVRGVVTSFGQYIPAKHVISNLMPDVVFSRLVERFEVPLRDRKAINARKKGQSCSTVYLALDIPYEEFAFKGYDTFIRFNGDTLRQYNKSSRLEDHDICVTCLNAAIPDCSPKGTTLLSFSMFYKENPFDEVSAEEYYSVKDKIAEEAVILFNRVSGLDLTGHILETEVTTPVTWARYLGTPDGCVYGYAPGGWDGMFARIQSVKELDYTVSGLRFCGGHGAYMNGYSQAILSGEQAALFTLEDMEKEGENG